VKAHTEEQLVAEGYQFYAQESLNFAAASAPAVAQAIIIEQQAAQIFGL
jgi:hypothetical protein